MCEVTNLCDMMSDTYVCGYGLVWVCLVWDIVPLCVECWYMVE